MFNIMELSKSHTVPEAYVQLTEGIFNMGLTAGSRGLSN